MRSYYFLITLMSICVISNTIQAQNKKKKSFKPGTVWVDNNGKTINAHGGGIIYVDGIYYWYGEHKLPNKSEKEKADGGVHCYSSTDLYHWEDKGIVLSVDYKNEKSDIADGCILERPKVTYNRATSRYMMYFKLYPKGQDYKYGYLGVAAAISPTGPFTYSHKFLGADSPYGSGDFCIYKDDDGKVYHFTVRKPDKAFVAGELNKEYTYPQGKYKVVTGITNETEAPAIFKHKGTYYLLGSGSSGWKPNAARIFTSKSITGDYTEKSNPCHGVNPYNGLGPEKTFGGQSSFIIPVQGKKNSYIAMFDIWKPEMPIEGLYIWLPIKIQTNSINIKWRDEWNLNIFSDEKKIIPPLPTSIY